ncbi:hypothetical protein MW887_010746 [Aspergillus wentii]|nr:hypothetical protein MW887_010746 [Aspergillus wentii]
MDILNRIFSFRRASKRQFIKSRFELLPTEILQLIAREYLTPVDHACLTLCSHALLHNLGSSSWPTAQDKQLKKAFLTRVSQDLIQSFLCQYCMKLHPSATVYPPGPGFYTTKKRLRSCPEQLGSCTPYKILSLSRYFLVPSGGSTYDFRFCHAALVMKRYCHGAPHGMAVESLSFTEVDSSRPPITTLVSAEGKVCIEESGSPTLVLRIQNWTLVHGSDQDIGQALETGKHMWICHHITFLHTKMQDYSKASARKRACHEALDDLRCRYCKIDFQVDIRNCADEGTAVVVTGWLDVGAGIDMDDAKWQDMVRFYPPVPVGVGAVPGSGAVRKLFQKTEATPSSVTERNQSLLIGKRYRSVMSPLRGWSHRWVIPADKPSLWPW